MLTAIKNLAGLSEVNEMESYLEYPGNQKNPKGYFILIDNNEYKEIKIEELDEEKTSLYLYPIQRVARGINKTPTIKYNDFKKSYKDKIYNWFNEFEKKSEIFANAKIALENNENLIKEELGKIAPNSFLSVKINDKYLGEFNEFINFIIDEEQIKSDISSIAYASKPLPLKNEYCSVCNEKKDELFGFAVPFSFYTFEKNKFSYDFNPNNAAKQCPICIDCAKKIRGNGLNYLNNNLNFRLCNSSYYLIPEFIFYSDENTEKFKSLIEKIKIVRENALTSKEATNIIRSENFILKEFKDENYLSLNLFFYEKEQKAFRILANIEEVLPSKLKRFYETVKIFENKFQELKITVKQEEKFSLKFHFGIISDILNDAKQKPMDYTKKEFFEILDKTLNFKSISEEFILKKAVKNLQFFYKNINDEKKGKLYKYLFKKLSFESFMFLNILYTLGITDNRKGNMENTNTPNLDLFCKEFPEFFESPLRKGVFGLGVLTEKLANIQIADGKSKAIYSSLKDFKMDLNYLQRNTFKLLKTKFHQYKKEFYYEKFAFEITQCLMTAEAESMSIGELNYVFILGMNSSKKLMSEIFGKQEKENEIEEVI